MRGRVTLLAMLVATASATAPAVALEKSCMSRFPQWHSDQKKEYQACETKQNDRRLGKYVCFVEQTTATYRRSEDQSVASRTDKSDIKFVLEISRDEPCDRCERAFLFRFKSDEKTGFGHSSDTRRVQSPLGAFTFENDDRFDQWALLGGTAVASNGRCEKLN
jgi:hypothetical protein